MKKNSIYPQKKIRELSKEERAKIREDIRKNNLNYKELAEKHGCSTSQITGIKAHM